MKTKNAMIRPIADHIVVRPEEAADTTPGGIVLPDAAKDKQTRGLVVAVGIGQLRQDGSRADMEVAEGDTIVYTRYGGTEVDIDDETFVVIRESDVLLIFEKKTAGRPA